MKVNTFDIKKMNEKKNLHGEGDLKKIYIQVVETHAKCLLRQISSLSIEKLN